MASTDAHKIVAVSLNKIAASRATRTGINLYKSLMVSSVLYKARTIVIMEKYNGPFTNCEKANDGSLETVEELQDCQDSSNDIPTTDIDDYDYDDDDQDDENCDGDDEIISDENQSGVSQDSEPSDTSDEETSSENKENSSQDNNQTSSSQGKTVLNDSSSSNCQVLKSCENTTQNLDNKEILKCERCTKRRYSDVESTMDNNSSSPKKMKNEDKEKSSENEQQQQEPTPMDGVQITQLVDSFTSGFTGLLSQGCNGSKSSSNILQISDQNNRTTKSHGLSEGFSHCSSQIKESFETLASPIISLGITA